MILVTGGTGLVGARLLYDLTASGKKVRAMRRAGSSSRIVDMAFDENPSLKNNIEWVQCDVTDVYDVAEAMDGAEEIFHCAAKLSFHPSDYREMMKVNVQGTANMVNTALENGVQRFCHVSSIAALGRVEENKVMNESVVWKTSSNNSMYAVSKYGGEREVWRAMEEGLNGVIVNPAIVIGPGDWKTGSSAMFGQLWNGLKFYSSGVNGFVDVRDVTRCMITLTEKKISGQRFILSADNCSYRQVFNAIADGLGKPRPSVSVGKFLSELGWRAEALRSFFARKQPFITKETARNSQHKWFYSNEKIKKETGIEFIPIEKSAADTAKIFMKYFAGRK